MAKGKTFNPVTFATLQELGLKLPGVTVARSYGAPALKMQRKLLACVPVNSSAEVNSAVVRIDLQRRAHLLNSLPQRYYTTEHYEPHPLVLVRLDRITRAELQRLLQLAHETVSNELKSVRPARRTINRRRKDQLRGSKN